MERQSRNQKLFGNNPKPQRGGKRRNEDEELRNTAAQILAESDE
jgi:hypothetical protein